VERIDVLPDDVLLEIFDVYLKEYSTVRTKRHVEAWQSLAHVCRRWRSLVFESPRRLNLQLCCTPETPVRDALDIWPTLPLIVRGNTTSSGTDNVITALVQSNRICTVDLFVGPGYQQLDEVLAAMQVPFPELTELRLSSYVEMPPVIPDSFLDGSAPRLRFLELDEIPFPGLPKLLLSATRLVRLVLSGMPHFGYISPEAMADLLCALSSLETLYLGFSSSRSRPGLESRSLPPPKRSILPALHDFHFTGITEYLEDLVIRIDTPQLKTLGITFFHQIHFDTPQLAQFIIRTPKLGRHDAHVRFDDWNTIVTLEAHSGTLEIEIPSGEPDSELWSVAQICNSSLPSLSTVKDLYIEHQYTELVWNNDAIENTQWLELLLPFTAVKNIYLSEEFALGITAALQELVGARITEVLPNLQNILVEGLEPWGPFQENIGQFAGARRRSGHPIAISAWN
jgi:hypothetical protein